MAVIGNKHGLGQESFIRLSALRVKNPAIGIGEITSSRAVGSEWRTVIFGFQPPRSQLKSGFFGAFPSVESRFCRGARFGALADVSVIFFSFSAGSYRIQIGEFFAALG